MGKSTLKGGTWTNVEDEILKVAVMKYGRHQWARISSLLVRKTAKQCKARWTEWLEPGIKKNEWSLAEEEKLLHLAKVMPSQWRTIAPIVGRTAAQCQEKYEALLAKAASLSNTSTTLNEGDESAPVVPEIKPSRPDPVDMDEEEKEMLSEARARLANTQGKKAKRKARHRLLEEARRQSTLQKRKELQEAGLPIMPGGRGYHRNLKLTNYNEEVPFEKKPLPGFHDVSSELEMESEVLAKRELELKIQGPDRELTLSRDAKDLQELKKAKERDQERMTKGFLPANLERKLREQQSLRRGMLNLPAPQISEAELETIAKLGHSSESALMLANQVQTPASSYLLDSATPMRSNPNMTPLSTTSAYPTEDAFLRKQRLQQAFAKLPPPSKNYDIILSEDDSDSEDVSSSSDT